MIIGHHKQLRFDLGGAALSVCWNFSPPGILVTVETANT